MWQQELSELKAFCILIVGASVCFRTILLPEDLLPDDFASGRFASGRFCFRKTPTMLHNFYCTAVGQPKTDYRGLPVVDYYTKLAGLASQPT